mmetsp:Transcript_8155/g.13237  ORF Transcript_8155/g.13237 Transcript_8155/m.13237 type:complete len:312 (-) Transcript_8155:79-1014(-)
MKPAHAQVADPVVCLALVPRQLVNEGQAAEVHLGERLRPADALVHRGRRGVRVDHELQPALLALVAQQLVVRERVHRRGLRPGGAVPRLGDVQVVLHLGRDLVFKVKGDVGDVDLVVVQRLVAAAVHAGGGLGGARAAAHALEAQRLDRHVPEAARRAEHAGAQLGQFRLAILRQSKLMRLATHMSAHGVKRLLGGQARQHRQLVCARGSTHQLCHWRLADGAGNNTTCHLRLGFCQVGHFSSGTLWFLHTPVFVPISEAFGLLPQHQGVFSILPFINFPNIRTGDQVQRVQVIVYALHFGRKWEAFVFCE